MAENESSTGSLVNEIEQLQKKLDRVSPKDIKEKRPARLPLFLPQLFLGSIFFILTLVLLYSDDTMLRTVSVVPFLITVLSLIYACSDIFLRSREGYWMIIGSLMIVLMGGLTIMLWEIVLVAYSPILLIIMGVALLLETIWFLLHAYLGFLYNKLGRESEITSLLLIASWILLVSYWVYSSVIPFLLLLIAIILFGKAAIDFSKRFVRT
ncbi:MAG: hypothetical protein ACQESE_03270 [Nanobdellota archaeon]